MLPPLTANASIYRSSKVYVNVAPYSGPSPPPAGTATWCGPDAQKYCTSLSGSEYHDCALIDCDAICTQDYASPACKQCPPRKQACFDRVRAEYADCGVCPQGTTCQTDIGTDVVRSGYTYCCPPDQSPCGGICQSTICDDENANFIPESCSCECDYLYARKQPGGPCLPLACPSNRLACRDDDGVLSDCCILGAEDCSHGVCCPKGQSYYGAGAGYSGCCDPDQWCEGVCCNQLSTCVLLYGGDCHCTGGLCCPGDQVRCGDRCCNPGNCFNNVCCPDGEGWCQGKILGGCCAEAKCCPGSLDDPCCDNANEHCSNDLGGTGEQHCCPAGNEWSTLTYFSSGAFHGKCCPTGQIYCGTPQTGLGCCPTNRCCANRTVCCPEGQHCSAGNHCCPDGSDWSNGHCCPTGQIWCSDKCCAPNACCAGVECADLQNDPAHCGNCLVSCVGGQVCRNGHCGCPDGRPLCGGVCCPAGLVCSNGACAIPCGTNVFQGGVAGETHIIELGKTSGLFNFIYNTLHYPDRMFVDYQNVNIFDTGCLGTEGPKTQPLIYSGASTSIRVRIVPNCDEANQGPTEWSFMVTCP